MDLDDISELCEDFKKDSTQLMKEFNKLFKHWIKKNPRLTIVHAMNMPINFMANLAITVPETAKFMPELPDVFIRMMTPFIFLRDKWGKIPNKDFFEEYKRLYEAQFDDWFPDAEMKQQFKEWYEKKSE